MEGVFYGITGHYAPSPCLYIPHTPHRAIYANLLDYNE